MATPNYHAVVQPSTHTVYGVGETPEAAWADAAHWTDDATTLCLVPCSLAAATFIKHGSNGGAPSEKLSVTSRGVILSTEGEYSVVQEARKKKAVK